MAYKCPDCEVGIMCPQDTSGEGDFIVPPHWECNKCGQCYGLDSKFEEVEEILSKYGVEFSTTPRIRPKPEHPLERICNGTTATKRAKY